MTHACENWKPGPYTADQCLVCWSAHNVPGGVLFSRKAVKAPAQPVQLPPPKPVSAWPWYARALAARRLPADVGLGDTVAHQLPAKAFQWVYRKLTGHDCPSCQNRQEALNALYSYPTERDESEPEPPSRSSPCPKQ